jgi:uncharacterized protein (DUF736 family)|tara:strand:+ start:864 stop:1160 length:297 start_codon:yes stop_codon:yes gene_type:complete
MSENTNNEWEKREIGALWTKTSQASGKKYFSGHFKIQTEFGEDKKVPVVAFFNKDKKSENSPDFRIYLSKPAETQTETKTEQQTATSTTQGDDGEALL